MFCQQTENINLWTEFTKAAFLSIRRAIYGSPKVLGRFQDRMPSRDINLSFYAL